MPHAKTTKDPVTDDDSILGVAEGIWWNKQNFNLGKTSHTSYKTSQEQ